MCPQEEAKKNKEKNEKHPKDFHPIEFSSYGAVWGIKEGNKKKEKRDRKIIIIITLSTSKCPHYCCSYSTQKVETVLEEWEL